MSISFETDGPVAIVTIDRPEVRNCVDGPTALELAAAFRRFEDSDDLLVGVLTGSKGAFCAGADLKAVGSSRGNKVSEDGDGPMGLKFANRFLATVYDPPMIESASQGTRLNRIQRILNPPSSPYMIPL